MQDFQLYIFSVQVGFFNFVGSLTPSLKTAHALKSPYYNAEIGDCNLQDLNPGSDELTLLSYISKGTFINDVDSNLGFLNPLLYG